MAASILLFLFRNILLVVSFSALNVSADFQFFTGPDGFGKKAIISSPACAIALNATIACEEFLVLKAHRNDYGWGNETLQDQLCNPTCGTSLASYSSGVASACGTNRTWEGLPNTYYG